MKSTRAKVKYTLYVEDSQYFVAYATRQDHKWLQELGDAVSAAETARSCVRRAPLPRCTQRLSTVSATELTHDMGTRMLTRESF